MRMWMYQGFKQTTNQPNKALYINYQLDALTIIYS